MKEPTRGIESKLMAGAILMLSEHRNGGNAFNEAVNRLVKQGKLRQEEAGQFCLVAYMDLTRNPITLFNKDSATADERAANILVLYNKMKTHM